MVIPEVTCITGRRESCGSHKALVEGINRYVVRYCACTRLFLWLSDKWVRLMRQPSAFDAGHCHRSAAPWGR